MTRLIESGRLLCIDPGPLASGVVVFDGVNVSNNCSNMDNDILIKRISNGYFECEFMAIEGIVSYGMAVGATVFDTAEFIGRARATFGWERTTKISRRDVKLFLCGTMRAKNNNVRRSVLDMFPKYGGGKTPEVGIKKKPGPLYGVSSHTFSALAIGLTKKYCNDL